MQYSGIMLYLLSLCTLTRKLILFIAHICFDSTMLKCLLWNFQLRGFKDEYYVVVVFDFNDANEYGNTTGQPMTQGAQWLSGRVLDSRPRGTGSSLTGFTALWSLSKTHLS